MGMIMHDDVPYGEGTSYTQGTGIAINNNVIAVDADNAPTEGSEKPVKSKGVYSALESNSAKSASLLKSTVGWTGKNYLRVKKGSGTVSGVNFVINDDGSVSVSGKNTGSGTAWFGLVESIYPISSGSYVLSGCPSGGSNNTYKLSISIGSDTVQDTGSGGSISAASDSDVLSCAIGIGAGYSISGTLTFKPMLRDASITDDTYEPYHESVEEEIEQIYADNGVLGAKNLLEVTANTQTLSGVTFTVNRDSDGNVINVTVNGTASANTSFVLRTKTPLAAGKSYIMSRGEAGDVDFQMVATAWNNGSYVKNIIEIGAGGYTEKSFMADYNGYNDIQISIFVRSGKTISNAKVYPMLRLASDPDDTYVPYAMTNRELTEKKINLSDLKTVVASSSDFAAFKTAIADL